MLRNQGLDFLILLRFIHFVINEKMISNKLQYVQEFISMNNRFEEHLENQPYLVETLTPEQ